MSESNQSRLNDYWRKAERAPKNYRGGRFTINEQVNLLAPHLLLAYFEGREVSPSQLLLDELEYARRGITGANGIGDVIGARGFGLYRSSRGVEPSFENARLILGKAGDLTVVAKQLGFETKDDLQLAIVARACDEFPKGTWEDEPEVLEALGFASREELLETVEKLPAPSLAN
ncbi:hypothetical protein [Rhodopirellula halodulae]|uniref:hypothetical protein n=1 Tax=Rhodopirellula halodulae TaxID=2894198 RepID=UPI001E5A1769|nr:hypothetical protein [Rhodopirellula sp. JC737]MCC9655306.1 hypothetical protein [Rhodopirellula sp. JC737]